MSKVDFDNLNYEQFEVDVNNSMKESRKAKKPKYQEINISKKINTINNHIFYMLHNCNDNVHQKNKPI